MRKIFTALFASLALAIGAGAVLAQSTAQPVTPGYLSLSCGTGPSPCFIPYGASGGSGGSPLPITAIVTGSASSATTLTNFPVDAGALGYVNVVVQFTSVGSGNTVIFEGSNDNVTFAQLLGSYPGDPDTALSAAGIVSPSTTGANSLYMYQIPTKYFRARVSVYGSGTVTLNAHFSSVKYTAPTVLQVKSNSTGSVGTMVPTGNVASGATDSGNPVKVGGVYNSTKPTLTNGQRGDLQLTTRGAAAVSIMGSDSQNGVVSALPNSDGLSTATNLALATQGFGYSYNGTSLDRDFTCPSSAVINVAAAATTELVALTASQVIRVCSFVISGDTAATTATFVYGTGANCGSGTTALTGAMRMVDEGNISSTGMNGSLFRTASANALCLTAVTGAVTGFVTYAKY